MATQFDGLTFKIRRGREHFGGRTAGLPRRLLDAGDVATVRAPVAAC